jgi:hypothetical protein
MKNKSDSMMQSIADDLRNIYRADQQHAETLIENYLMERLSEYALKEKLTIIADIAHQFELTAHREKKESAHRYTEIRDLYPLLLGDKTLPADLSPEEINEKIAEALNTIFNKVNEIVRTIHATLFGARGELQTIRRVIGDHVEGKTGGSDSIKSYLDQIQDAFLTSHRAFLDAATTTVRKILDELDPDNIAHSTDKGMKFGALYKAELFEAYKASYQECRSWFESNRYKQDVLREFEKFCQKSYKTQNS